jgi:hypothetical protein
VPSFEEEKLEEEGEEENCVIYTVYTIAKAQLVTLHGLLTLRFVDSRIYL